MHMNQVIKRAVRVLNEALEADPEAIHRLFNMRVSVNDELGQHPTIQVWSREETSTGQLELRVLGLINGLFGIFDNGSGYIGVDVEGALCDEYGPCSYRIKRFLAVDCSDPSQGAPDGG